jgi:hypothetical protein
MKKYQQEHQSSRGSFPLQRQFKGGGGGSGTPPPAVPPVAQSSTDVADAERQARLAASKKQGMKSTLLAGAAGTSTSDKLGTKSLLG